MFLLSLKWAHLFSRSVTYIL